VVVHFHGIKLLNTQHFVNAAQTTNIAKQLNKKGNTLEAYSKGQFFKNMAYLERGMPYLRLCLQMQCLPSQEKQIDFQGTQKATVRIDPWLLFYFVYSTNWNLKTTIS